MNLHLPHYKSEYQCFTTYNPEISGVTRQNIKMQKTSEIQPISEVFRHPLTKNFDAKCRAA